MASIATRIAAGVALLDKVTPDWPLRIDLDDFDMGEANLCTLAYVYGTFESGIQKLQINGVRHGFVATKRFWFSDLRRDLEHWRLTRAWRRVITKRQYAVAQKIALPTAA